MPDSPLIDHAVTPAEASTHVGQVIAGGVLWEHLSPPSARVREGDDEIALPARRDPAVIAEQTEALLDMLVERQIDCVLVGGVAMLQYVSGRNTKDIDFIAPKSEVKRCPEIYIRHQDMNFAQGQFGSLNVDFLYTSNRLFKYVAEHHSQPRQLGNRTMRVATPEGLVLLKLYAMPNLLVQLREGKLNLYEADIRELLANHVINDTSVVDVLRKHLKPGEWLVAKTLLQESRQHIQARRAQMQQLREGDGTC